MAPNCDTQALDRGMQNTVDPIGWGAIVALVVQLFALSSHNTCTMDPMGQIYK